MQPIWYWSLDQDRHRRGREEGMDIKDVSKVGATELGKRLKVGSGPEGTAKAVSEFPCLDNYMVG